MRKLLLVAAFALVCSSMAFATVTQTIEICNGNGTGCVTSAAGAAGLTDNTFGPGGLWNVSVILSSFSPSDDPLGLSAIVTAITCNGSATDCSGKDLEVLVSDTGFTTPVGGFTLGFVDTQTGPGHTTATGYEGSTIFDTTNTVGPTITLGTNNASAKDKTFKGNSAASLVAGPSPYSLTIVEHFGDSAAKGDGSKLLDFTTTAQLSGVPEPTSIVLFGTILSLGGFAFRRRLKKNS